PTFVTAAEALSWQSLFVGLKAHASTSVVAAAHLSVLGGIFNLGRQNHAIRHSTGHCFLGAETWPRRLRVSRRRRQIHQFAGQLVKISGHEGESSASRQSL